MGDTLIVFDCELDWRGAQQNLVPFGIFGFGIFLTGSVPVVEEAHSAKVLVEPCFFFGEILGEIRKKISFLNFKRVWFLKRRKF